MFRIVKRLELCVMYILVNIDDNLRQETTPTSNMPVPLKPSGPQPLTLKVSRFSRGIILR